VLARLAALDPDDTALRKKLAQLSLAAGDAAGAVRWGREALYTDVMDVDVHRLLGEAYAASEQYARAIDELQVAIRLDGRQAALHLALARACVADHRTDEARAALAKVRELEPNNAAAAALLEKLAE
jgi:Flp pilus assembly protein TadD